MQNPIADARHALTDQIELSSGQLGANLHKWHDIAAQIGAFHMERAEIYRKTFEKLAGIKDMEQFLALQQEFIQSSMDNMLSHTKTITELMAQSTTDEFEEKPAGRSNSRRK